MCDDGITSFCGGCRKRICNLEIMLDALELDALKLDALEMF